MNMRLKRLQADYERIRLAFGERSPIQIKAVYGNPPEKYHMVYRVKGLALQGGKVAAKSEHQVEINLTAGYPRQAPQCRMLTPVFHPNIAPHAICIGDHWAAAESLADLIVRIGEMISYQSYNTKSPLNGDAARYADTHAKEFPVDATDLSLPDLGAPAPSGGGEAPAALGRCGNCGGSEDVQACPQGHAGCVNCRLDCSSCAAALCVVCGPKTCHACRALLCATCAAACANCGQALCAAHRHSCRAGGETVCGDCAGTCPYCGGEFCLAHFNPGAGACLGCAPPMPAAVKPPLPPPLPAPPPPPPKAAITPVANIASLKLLLACPSCQRQLMVPTALAGRSAMCYFCRTVFQVPRPRPFDS